MRLPGTLFHLFGCSTPRRRRGNRICDHLCLWKAQWLTIIVNVLGTAILSIVTNASHSLQCFDVRPAQRIRQASGIPGANLGASMQTSTVIMSLDIRYISVSKPLNMTELRPRFCGSPVKPITKPLPFFRQQCVRLLDQYCGPYPVYIVSFLPALISVARNAIQTLKILDPWPPDMRRSVSRTNFGKVLCGGPQSYDT